MAIRTAENYLETKPDVYENFFRMKTKSGDYRWIYAQGRVVERDPNGGSVRMIGNHMDITDRELLNKQIREIERRNQALLDHSPVCHKIVDLDFNLQYMSANGFRMLQLAPDAEVYGKPYPFEFFPETFKRKMTENLEYVKKTGETITMEALTHDVKGNEVWLDSSLIPVFDDDGKIDYITVVSANTTRRKLDEQDRKRLQEKLAQSQKMETIGTLAGGIAHDFNNILYPIIGFSEMLTEDLAEGSLEYESARDILKAGKRGADLVKQILSFSRQTEHKMSPIRIQHVLKEVLKLSRSTIPSYIEIHQDIKKDCGLIMADFTQIHQVAMNIITNAYHAVETGGGEISVVLRETKIADDSPEINLGPGEYAILSISDTGPGIPPENIDKIFDPYFTTKKQGKGTGLGLSVVYAIVREHRGDIKVYTETGKGTTFNIYLPLILKTGEFGETDATEKLPAGNERILLVDDDSSVLKLEKLMLERLGYTVTGCISSAEALEIFRETPNAFDLIVSDMNMPGIPGDRLAGDIKSIRTDIPIIICTGFSDRINADEIGALGIEGILMKPVVKSEMAKMVRNVIEGE